MKRKNTVATCCSRCFWLLYVLQVRNTFNFKCATHSSAQPKVDGVTNSFSCKSIGGCAAASATTLLKLENVLAEITHISGKKRQSFLCLNLQPDVLYACYMVVPVTIIIHGIKKSQSESYRRKVSVNAGVFVLFSP